MILQFSAQLDSIKANSDRTLSIKLNSQELPPGDTAQIFALMERQIWIAFAETVVTREDLNIPEVVDDLANKSPSQRLRDRLFVYHKEKKIGSNFDDFYKKTLDIYGQKYLDALQ